jgi:hypothetical protein
MIAEYEIWVSDNPIGPDPQASEGAYMAAKGSWTYAAQWFTADFTAEAPNGLGRAVPRARYIQVRSYADGNGPTANGFEICGSETRVDIAGAFDGTIDAAGLESVYVEAMSLLPSLSKASGARQILETKLPKAAGYLSDAEDTFGLSMAEKEELQKNIDESVKTLYGVLAEFYPK